MRSTRLSNTATPPAITPTTVPVTRLDITAAPRNNASRAPGASPANPDASIPSDESQKTW
ncbi:MULTISPECIES: hypothetical protein [Micromonospora]|uniref:hypothetical protein n=1 Tax=Micromonospora TaxID=1873 RepID=UPI0005BD7F11